MCFDHGGALNIQEPVTALDVESDNPRLVARSVFHTDSANTHTHTHTHTHAGSRRHPDPGILQELLKNQSLLADYEYVVLSKK